MLSAFTWLQKSLMILHTSTVVDFHEADLQEVSAKVAAWFQECTPKNVEQRLQGLHLAIKIARNYEGDLSQWGYNPSDPFNDGSGRLSEVCAGELAASNDGQWILDAPEPDSPDSPVAGPGNGASKEGRASRRPFSAVWE